jgi:hypothetical protein
MAAEQACEKVACGMALAVHSPGAAPAGITGAALSDGRAQGNGPPSGFVALSGKSVRNGLGGKADFSYWQC